MKSRSLQENIYMSRSFLLNEGKYSALKRELEDNLPKVSENKPIEVFNYFARNKKDIPEFVYNAFFNKKQMLTGYLLSSLIPHYNLQIPERFYKFITHTQIFSERDIVKLHLYHVKKNIEISSELLDRIRDMYKDSEGEAELYGAYDFWHRRLIGSGEPNEYRMVFIPRYVYTLYSKNKQIDPFLEDWLNKTPSGVFWKEYIFDEKKNPLDYLRDGEAAGAGYNGYTDLYLKESTEILEEEKYDALKQELEDGLLHKYRDKTFTVIKSLLYRNKEIPKYIYDYVEEHQDSFQLEISTLIKELIKDKKEIPEFFLKFLKSKGIDTLSQIHLHYVTSNIELPHVIKEAIKYHEKIGDFGSLYRYWYQMMKYRNYDGSFGSVYLPRYIYTMRQKNQELDFLLIKWMENDELGMQWKKFIFKDKMNPLDVLTNSEYKKLYLKESIEILEEGKYDALKDELIKNISKSGDKEGLSYVIPKIFEKYYDKDELDSDDFKKMFNTSTSTVFIEKINDMISKAVWNGDVKNKKSFIPFILSTPALLGKKLSIILNFLDKYKLRDHFNNWLDDATMNDIRDVIIDNQPAAFISMMWRDAETENIEQLFKKYEKNIRSLEEKLNGSYDLYYYISFLLEHGRIPSNQIYDKFFNKKDNSLEHHAYKLLVDIIKKNESGSEIPIDERLIQAVAKSSLYSHDLVKFVKAGIPSWNDKKGSLDKTPVNYKVPDIIKQKASEYKEEPEDRSFHESTNLLEEGKYDELKNELIQTITLDMTAVKLDRIIRSYYNKNEMNSDTLKGIILKSKETLGEGAIVNLLKMFVRNEIDRVIRDVYIGWGKYTSFIDFIFETPSLLNDNFGVVYEFLWMVSGKDNIMDIVKRKFPDSIIRFEQEREDRIKKSKETQDRTDKKWDDRRKEIYAFYGIKESANILEEAKYGELRNELYDSLSSNIQSSLRYAALLLRKGKNIPNEILEKIAEDADSSGNLAIAYLEARKKPPEILINSAALYPHSAYLVALYFLERYEKIPDVLIDSLSLSEYYSFRISKEIISTEMINNLIDDESQITDKMLKRVLESDIYSKKFLEFVKDELNDPSVSKKMGSTKIEFFKKRFNERIAPYSELILGKQRYMKRTPSLNESTNVLEEGKYSELRNELMDKITSNGQDMVNAAFTYITRNKPLPEKIIKILKNHPNWYSEILAGRLLSSKVPIPEYLIDIISTDSSASSNVALAIIKKFGITAMQDTLLKRLINSITRSEDALKVANKMYSHGIAIPDHIIELILTSKNLQNVENFIIFLAGNNDMSEYAAKLWNDSWETILKNKEIDILKIVLEIIRNGNGYNIPDIVFEDERITKHNSDHYSPVDHIAQQFLKHKNQYEYINDFPIPDKVLEIIMKYENTSYTLARNMIAYKVGEIPQYVYSNFMQNGALAFNFLSFFVDYQINNYTKVDPKQEFPKELIQNAIKWLKEDGDKFFTSYRIEKYLKDFKEYIPSLNESTNVLEEGKYDDVKEELRQNILSKNQGLKGYLYRIVDTYASEGEDGKLPDSIINLISRSPHMSYDFINTVLRWNASMKEKERVEDLIPEPILYGAIKESIYGAIKGVSGFKDAGFSVSRYQSVIKLIKFYNFEIPEIYKRLKVVQTPPVPVRYESTNVLEEGKYDELRNEISKALENKHITYKGYGVLNLPQLQTSRSIDALNAKKINLPQLQTSEDINIPRAKEINLSRLETCGHVNAYHVTKINLPQLQTCKFFHASNATEINLPQLKFSYGVIFANKATGINLPQLKKTSGNIYAPNAKTIIIPKNLVQYLQDIPEDCEIIHPEKNVNESTNVLEEGKYDSVKDELAKALGNLNGDEEEDNYTDKMEDIRERMIHKMMRTDKIPEWYFHVEKSKAFQYLADLVNRRLSGNKSLIDLHERKMVEYAYEYGLDIYAVTCYVDFLIAHNKPLDNILKLIHHYGDKEDIEYHGGKAWNTYGMVMNILKNINNIHLIPIKILDIVSQNAFYGRSIIQDVLRNYDKLEKEFKIPTFMFKNIAKDEKENVEFVKFIILHTSFNVPDINAKALSEDAKEYLEKQWQGNMSRMYEFNK